MKLKSRVGLSAGNPILGRLKRFSPVATLKGRLIALMVGVALACCSLMAAVSYRALYDIQQNKLRTAMRYDLQQESASLQQIYSNLLQISQQLTPQGPVGSLVDSYWQEQDPYARSVLSRNISDMIGLVTFPNPNVELVSYMDRKNGSPAFSNLALRGNLGVQDLPRLAGSAEVTYQAPHRSLCRFSGDTVVSISRRVTFSDEADWDIYVESRTSIPADMSASHIGGHTQYIFLLLDTDSRIVYSSREKSFRTGTRITLGASTGLYRGYVYNRQENDYGYVTALLTPTGSYNRELYAWRSHMLMLIGIILIVVGLISVSLWRLIYRPLLLFEADMKNAGQGCLRSCRHHTGVAEFDRLFEQFDTMKTQFHQLLEDRAAEEKQRHRMELEMLTYQINPHFLMNALNSVHWLAVIHQQPEIDHMILTLNLLLSYNLGRNSREATLRTELQVLTAYLDLQQARSDFTVRFHVQEGDYLDVPVARFILQPIAENAVCHGLDDGGTITVDAALSEDRRTATVVIRDDGLGLSEETLRLLRDSSAAAPHPIGRGIGLRYVRRTLESYYGSEATMTIDSQRGAGTAVTLRLPLHRAGDGK